MPDATLLLLTGAGIALGVGAAQIGGPVSWNWRPRRGAIMQRLRCLPHGAAPIAGRAAGLAVLAAVLAGGALGAYAAEPSAPERLAKQATGVVGSGDQLSLKIREAAGERTVKVGEAYADGWTLQALTPTKATLAKDGATREVGLNPTGAIASTAPAAASSTVSVVGLPSEATIQAAVDRALAVDPRAVERARGEGLELSVEEARRVLAYQSMTSNVMARNRRPDGSGMVSGAQQLEVMGEQGYADYWALMGRLSTGNRDRAIAYLADLPAAWPNSFYAPAGADLAAVRSAQGIDGSGGYISSAPDAQGGRTYTRITAEEFAARIPVPDGQPQGTIYSINLPTRP